MNTVLVCGLIIAVVLIALLLMGAPISIAIGAASVLAVLPVLDTSAVFLTGAQRTFSGISVFTLIAIPFFILAGNIMNRGGIAMRLINLAQVLTGRVPGSLAHTNSIANMLFGAISGSGVASASAMGTIIGPIEEKKVMTELFSSSNIATAPTGLLIPPSNVLITFSLVSGGTSVAALFYGRLYSWYSLGSILYDSAFFIARKYNYRSTQHVTVKEGLQIVWQAVPSLLLIIIVIGGIIKGIFTATEGSVVAVVYSLILSLIYKTIKIKDLYGIIKESAITTGIIVFLIGVSSFMAWVMTFTGIPEAISTLLLGISSNKIILLLIINVVLLFIGTFMDITPAILIFTPIFMPVCQELGMTAVQFGIMLVLNLCIGTITPPVGNILFVGVRVANTKIEDVIKPLLKYYVAIFLVLMLVTFVPAISTWLPTVMGLMG